MGQELQNRKRVHIVKLLWVLYGHFEIHSLIFERIIYDYYYERIPLKFEKVLIPKELKKQSYYVKLFHCKIENRKKAYKNYNFQAAFYIRIW